MTTVYASIGNSDDKLTQQKWSRFAQAFMNAVDDHADQIHGEWFSAPDAPFQNACAAFEINPEDEQRLRRDLEILRVSYDQDSIAWAVAPTTEFLKAAP